LDSQTDSNAAQRAKITEKVHKPPLGVNVINFELNRFNPSTVDSFSIPEVLAVRAELRKAEIKLHPITEPPNSGTPSTPTIYAAESILMGPLEFLRHQ
jgi:hypothetical protein